MAIIGSKISNAILKNHDPKGASKKTCIAERISLTGVAASRKLAELDMPRVLNNVDNLINVANYFNFPPALLAAIASRESHFGALLDDKGYGDAGHAFGIFQIDSRSHTLLGKHDPYSFEHINQAGGILNEFRTQLATKQPHWMVDEILQSTLAAYNMGVGNVKTIDGIDIGTTHDDYSNDIWARALYFAGF